MNSIDVRVRPEAGGWVCDVEVDQAGRRTGHTVWVSPADVRRWAAGETDPDVAELVRRSFDFLLEREPASSILRSFDLAVIQRYFPEYDLQFKR